MWKTHNVQPGKGWGTLARADQRQWRAFNCDEKLKCFNKAHSPATKATMHLSEEDQAAARCMQAFEGCEDKPDDCDRSQLGVCKQNEQLKTWKKIRRKHCATVTTHLSPWREANATVHLPTSTNPRTLWNQWRNLSSDYQALDRHTPVELPSSAEYAHRPWWAMPLPLTSDTKAQVCIQRHTLGLLGHYWNATLQLCTPKSEHDIDNGMATAIVAYARRNTEVFGGTFYGNEARGDHVLVARNVKVDFTGFDVALSSEGLVRARPGAIEGDGCELTRDENGVVMWPASVAPCGVVYLGARDNIFGNSLVLRNGALDECTNAWHDRPTVFHYTRNWW
jgi:hypothetical protein